MSTKTIDIKGILARLPHRYPFLLVDRVIAIEPQKSITAVKNVTVNEPFFTGHFPDNPVMPGVLILEALAQVCGVLAAAEDASNVNDYQNLFAGIDNARFRHVVTPGDQLTLCAEFEREKAGFYKFKCKATVEGELAASADLLLVRRKVSQ